MFPAYKSTKVPSKKNALFPSGEDDSIQTKEDSAIKNHSFSSFKTSNEINKEPSFILKEDFNYVEIYDNQSPPKKTEKKKKRTEKDIKGDKHKRKHKRRKNKNKKESCIFFFAFLNLILHNIQLFILFFNLSHKFNRIKFI